MARTAITRNSAQGAYSAKTVTPQNCDSTNGNKFVSVGRELLVVENTTAGTLSVTIPAANQEAHKDWTVSLAASAIAIVGPFSAEFINEGSEVYVDSDASADEDLAFNLIGFDQGRIS